MLHLLQLKLGVVGMGSQHYSSSIICKIIHKIGFLGHPMEASQAIYALYPKFITQRNLVAEFYRENVSFTRKTANKRFCITLFGGLGITYAIHL